MKMHSQVSNVQAQHTQHVKHVKQVKARQRTMTYAKSQATSWLARGGALSLC